METTLVRLKPHDPRRRFVLRRFAYAGILFHEERGWYRVPLDIAQYLRGVRQSEFNPYSPPAFDVCTEEEARALEEREQAIATARRVGVDAAPTTLPRATVGAVTSADVAGGGLESDDEEPAPAPAARPARQPTAPRARGEARR